MQWFGKEPRAAVISFELEAIANCAVHPKFLDEALVSTAKVDEMYLEFSDHLHDFVDAVEEKWLIAFEGVAGVGASLAG